jgi:hypothetical protein
MKPKDPTAASRVPVTPNSPLTDLVNEKLNKPVPERIAEELDDDREAPPRGGVRDYAHGTAEHDDEPEQ